MAGDCGRTDTASSDRRAGPYQQQARLAAGAAEAARLAALADTEMWAVAWNGWHDAHAKLNSHRNGMYDDPVPAPGEPAGAGGPFDLWGAPPAGRGAGGG